MDEYLDRSEITFLPQEYFTDNKIGGRRAIALNLLRENIPLETIARMMGLTIAQLQDLQVQSAAT